MRARFIIDGDPFIEIILQRGDARIELLADREAVELLEHGAMKALADPVGLRALGFRAGVIDILDGKIR